ncbi:MAG: hypothetical protein KatS3mg038_2999 [Candidatus Kapaibacterium sp.]|jgi:predicted  nucleic acid-binding Zn-ribbon protein|nr:MAG: hypothetical protein KatS3mg038_2999 [Candidatus Kapabacteria bacterium]
MRTAPQQQSQELIVKLPTNDIERQLDAKTAKYYRDLAQKISIAASTLASVQADIRKLQRELATLKPAQQLASRRAQEKQLKKALAELSMKLAGIIEATTGETPSRLLDAATGRNNGRIER